MSGLFWKRFKETAHLTVVACSLSHPPQFEDEFENVVKYNFLENYKVFSVPERCPHSNFSKVLCLLQRWKTTGWSSRALTEVFFLSPGGLSPQNGPRPSCLHSSPEACGEGVPRQLDLLTGQILQRPPDQPLQRKGEWKWHKMELLKSISSANVPSYVIAHILKIHLFGF